jgi:CDP-diacylglycerol--serine O-phosphatidyltransferase
MKHIPNLLTLANLFFGCCALLYTLAFDPVTAALFTLGSFLCDYADGMTARALNVSSPLGKELDSLADVVSFGVVPGAMLYNMLKITFLSPGASGPGPEMFAVCAAALPAFILSASSGLRLGRFNLDTRQTSYFIGLSTPACTVFVLGLTLADHNRLFGISEWLHQPWLLYGLTGVLSVLLNSEIPMFGMKIKRFDLQSNLFNLAFVALFAVLLFFLKTLAFSVIIVVYILASVIFKNKVVQG